MRSRHLAMTGAVALSLLAAPALAQSTMSTMPSRIPNPASKPQSSAEMSPSSQATSHMQASSGVSLSSVSNAKQTLASASVKDSSGQTLGQVEKVKTTASGTPTAVEVNLTSAPTPKTVQLKASQLRYDQSSNMLMTVGLSASEVQSMPAMSNP